MPLDPGGAARYPGARQIGVTLRSVVVLGAWRHRHELLITALLQRMRWRYRIEKLGAGEGIRTPDPNLGKVVLYP
jgi:hypothetical protein